MWQAMYTHDFHSSVVKQNLNNDNAIGGSLTGPWEKCLSGYQCLWEEPVLLKGKCQAVSPQHIHIPPSLNGLSSLKIYVNLFIYTYAHICIQDNNKNLWILKVVESMWRRLRDEREVANPGHKWESYLKAYGVWNWFLFKIMFNKNFHVTTL